jgi:RimJ/RimL family protein N-acetyltransferase
VSVRAPPTLTDGVLQLDAFTSADVDAHLAGEDGEHARRFGWWPASSTTDTVGHAFGRWERDWAIDGPTRAFAARIGGDLVGGCELRQRSKGQYVLAYWVHPPHRRKGYATRIAALATTYAMQELGASSVELQIEPDNVGSLRVAEKNGYQAVGETIEHTDAGTRRLMLVYRRTRP